MAGFNGVFSFNKNDKNKIFEEKKYKDSYISIDKTDNGKFYNDKLFFEDNKKIFLLDGVILNNHELEKEYKLSNWKDTFLTLYKEDNFNFLNKLRGSFCGLIYDTEKKELILFTDQIKSKNIYYSLKENEFIFSTDIQVLASLNKKENILDEDASYLLLTYGGTLEERTLFKNIKKLNFGTFLTVNLNEKLTKENYFMLDNTSDDSITKEKAIEEIDKLFRNAIKLEYDKDLEYGYGHIVGLSAGRDSRMNTWIANSMGYTKNVLNYTFSESNELDEVVPKQIAKDLKQEWIFKALDNGNLFYNIDEVIKKSCGEVNCSTLLHGKSMSKYINYQNFGISHNGMIGDVVFSVFGNKKLVLNTTNIKDAIFVYSKKLLNKVSDKKIIKNFYKDEEIFNHINRGIHVTSMSNMMGQENIEIVSPFLDIELLNYCLSIPYNIRVGNDLYDSWILNKYPKAAKYSHNGRKIGEKEIKIFGRSIPVSQFLPRVLRKLKLIKGEKGMNPFDVWYKENEKLRNFLDSYYSDNINRLEEYTELKEDCIYLYENGNVSEKCQVLTLLGTLKLYF